MKRQNINSDGSIITQNAIIESIFITDIIKKYSYILNRANVHSQGS